MNTRQTAIEKAREYHNTSGMYLTLMVKRSTKNNYNVYLYELINRDKPLFQSTNGYHCKYTEVLNRLVLMLDMGKQLESWSFNSMDDLENRFKQAGLDIEVGTDSTISQINYNLFG